MINFVCLLLGRIALTSAGSMIIPYLYTIEYENGAMLDAFSKSILISLAVMIFLFAKGEKHPEKLNVTGGAAFLFLTWLLYSLLGTMPYVFSGTLNFVNALLECLSGYTTTGLTGLDNNAPDSIILWCSITQWIGGLNILILLTAIVPAVTKGFGIYFAIPISLRQSTMTLKHIDRYTFKVTIIYSAFTCMGLSFFMLSGLNFFDALNFVMVTISTGGRYIPDTNFQLNIWTFVVMLFGLGASFLNILIYLQSASLIQLKKGFLMRMHSSELRYFLIILIISSTICALDLYRNDYCTAFEAIYTSIFFAASFASTTGIMTEKIMDAPELFKLILMLLAMVGGCMGSMAGGFKMLRLIILLKTSWAEMKRTLHPRQVISLKVDNGIVPNEVVRRVLSFFFLYCVILFFSMMLISLSGCTMLQSMYIAIGCLTSTGQLILFGMTPAEIYNIPDYIELICCFLMVLGKAEILSFLILIQACIQQINKKNW